MIDVRKTEVVRVSAADFDKTTVRRRGTLPMYKAFDDLLHKFHPAYSWMWCDKIIDVRRETGFASDDYVLTLSYTGEAYREPPPLEDGEVQ